MHRTLPFLLLLLYMFYLFVLHPPGVFLRSTELDALLVCTLGYRLQLFCLEAVTQAEKQKVISNRKYIVK